MADRLTPDQRHLNMSRIRSANTKPELDLRHALWKMGFRYRVNDRRLPGKPVIVLPKYKTVIFVHGCFWHGHEGCRFFVVPSTHTEFWADKILKNRERDAITSEKIESLGWTVITVWECTLKGSQFEQTLTSLSQVLQSKEAVF